MDFTWYYHTSLTLKVSIYLSISIEATVLVCLKPADLQQVTDTTLLADAIPQPYTTITYEARHSLHYPMDP